MTPEQERDYIQQTQKNPQAFVHLYDHYFPRIHAYIRYRVYDQQDAEDVIADVFFKAIRGLRHFKWRNRNSFAAWLFRIAHNQVVDYYRQHKHVELSFESDDYHAEPANHTPLPRRREIIILKFFGGLRNHEISNILELDERTVAAHLSRGLQDLRRRYTAQIQSETTVEVEI